MHLDPKGLDGNDILHLPDFIEPTSNGLQPTSDGHQPRSDGAMASYLLAMASNLPSFAWPHVLLHELFHLHRGRCRTLGKLLFLEEQRLDFKKRPNSSLLSSPETFQSSTQHPHLLKATPSVTPLLYA